MSCSAQYVAFNFGVMSASNRAGESPRSVQNHNRLKNGLKYPKASLRGALLSTKATNKLIFRTTSKTNSARRTLVCVAGEGLDNISVLEASGLLEAEYVYLDVRSVEEFAAGHVEGAVNIPWMNIEFGAMTPNPTFMGDVEAAFPDKSTKFLMGCKSGRRSMFAGTAMGGQGYSDMVNVEGGFDEWQACGLPFTQ
mmetsp:Transcript_39925/g.55504  ORF Transcript_39925/g.55504 Transcript_39925/m.55504 type:complete len:195 (+) Transcript_39925:96-680(+)|eukprot:CAMPEP_0196590558 /NCGR_PEP_ID=MMETSP1081-20130531/66938_1 /TAXON_ID=36882 /ORGANISM="Pyramimonas amylifera, Strain CCMP720" /LENGTH=194 /DNA_ID=CAMNT_0041913701 /DNA_START=85 /DNA_END=669 /DNA_ORIENTATION=-